jgi:tetratricopeptide (TPR) repeat protein
MNGSLQKAADAYKLAMHKCSSDAKLMQTSTYKKTATNYAVILEKIGRRNEATRLLHDLKTQFAGEVKVLNNLGIIQKRKGEVQNAIESYKKALSSDPQSFLPNHNLAVLLATEASYEEAVTYFKESLRITQKSKDQSQELGVLLNISLCYEQLKQPQSALEFL